MGILTTNHLFCFSYQVGTHVCVFLVIASNQDCHEISKFILDTIKINSATCHIAPSAAAALSAMLAKQIVSVYNKPRKPVSTWNQIEENITGYSESNHEVKKCLETITH